MNKFNLFAINLFRSLENRKTLKKNIILYFCNDQNITNYLDKNFDKHVNNFASQAEKDFMYTDTANLQYMDEQNPQLSAKCLSNKFFQYMIGMLSGDFLNSGKCRMENNVPVYTVNDGLNVTHQTVVAALPRNVLCDKDTRAVDNPYLNFAGSGDWQKYANHVANDDVKGLKFRRIDYDKNPYDDPNSARSYYDCVYGAVAKSADLELNKWWYNRRGSTIRDDPAGEINRDRIPHFSAGNDCTPNRYKPSMEMINRNQNEFPYGNAGAWRNGFYNSAEGNPNETKTLRNKYIIPSSDIRTNDIRTNDIGSTNSGRKSESFQMKKNMMYFSGNSDCAYRSGNHEWGSGYDYQGVDNNSDNAFGDENNKFTGEPPEYNYNPVDHLLNTPYIQTLNDQYGNTSGKSARKSDNVIRSTFLRGKYGAATTSAERPQNNVKIWTDGNGFEDQSNPYAMEKLLNRRIFRSFNLGKDCGGNPSIRYGDKHGDSADSQIPWFERALYNRYYEKDVEENIGGFELDGMNRGYGKDMQSLYCRLQKYPQNIGKNVGKSSGKSREYRMPGGYNDRTKNPQWEFLYKYY